MKLLATGRRGYVYLGEKNNLKYIRKIAKSQDNKGSILKETQILRYLMQKKFSYIPSLLDSGDDWFEQNYIEGTHFDKFLKQASFDKKRELLLQLLKIAYELDRLRVHHGELARPTKNLIVDKNNKLRIIDFERGRLLAPEGKNLRDLMQFLLSQGVITKKQAIRLGHMRNIDEIYKLLKNHVKYYPYNHFIDIIWIFVFLILADNITKSWFTVQLNQGSSFGISWFSNQLLIILGLIVAFLITYWSMQKKLPVLPSIFLIAGIVGNTVDRIFYEGVRDWINWGIFTNNLADIWMAIGIFGILYCYILSTYGKENIYRRYSWLCGGT